LAQGGVEGLFTLCRDVVKTDLTQERNLRRDKVQHAPTACHVALLFPLGWANFRLEVPTRWPGGRLDYNHAYVNECTAGKGKFYGTFGRREPVSEFLGPARAQPFQPADEDHIPLDLFHLLKEAIQAIRVTHGNGGLRKQDERNRHPPFLTLGGSNLKCPLNQAFLGLPTRVCDPKRNFPISDKFVFRLN